MEERKVTVDVWRASPGTMSGTAYPVGLFYLAIHKIPATWERCTQVHNGGPSPWLEMTMRDYSTVKVGKRLYQLRENSRKETKDTAPYTVTIHHDEVMACPMCNTVLGEVNDA